MITDKQREVNKTAAKGAINMGDVVEIGSLAIYVECKRVLEMPDGPNKYLEYAKLHAKYGEILASVYENFKSMELTNNQKWLTVVKRDRKPDKVMVNTSLLAEHIIETSRYYIVSKQGKKTQFIYWYEGGYYKQIATSELKAKIKEFIPLGVRKPAHWEEVYRYLITTSNYITFEQMNGRKEERFINFKNGLLDLETFTLVEHNPSYKHTTQIPFSFNADAKEPTTWLNFINTLTSGDIAMQQTLQEWFGLNLSNYNVNMCKKALALYGSVGNTEKSKYIAILSKMLDADNVSAIPIQDLCERFCSGDLYGKKALIIDDQKGDCINNGSIFKTITGMGAITGWQKNKPPFTFTFKGGITFTCNNMPHIKDDNGSHMFDRFLIIPCDNVIPSEGRDEDLLEKLEKEMCGIIVWAVKGLERLIKNEFKLTISEASEEAGRQYKGSMTHHR